MSTTPIHVQEKRKRPIINGDPHPTPLRIKEGSHVIKKVPLFSSHNKTRVPKRYPGKPSSPMVIHTNPDDFKALVQRLTGLPQPDQVIKNEKASTNVVDHHCTGSSSVNPIHESYLSTSHQFLADNDMPTIIPNSVDLSLLPPLPPPLPLPQLQPQPQPQPPPVYMYADTMSFSSLPNMGSSLPLYTYADPMSFTPLPNQGSSLPLYTYADPMSFTPLPNQGSSLPLYTYADPMSFTPLPNQGSSLPPYTYSDPMSFSPFPNMESSILPIQDEFIQDEFLLPIEDEFIPEEFLDIETLIGF